MEKLRKQLRNIDRKPYKSYKGLSGCYAFADYTLTVNHIQGDPFAAASRFSIHLPMSHAGFPQALWQNEVRRIACEDFIGREVKRAIHTHTKGQRGSGKSGEVAIETSGQQVLLRNAVLVSEETLEVRIIIGLPADLRTINSREAEVMFFEELPKVVAHSLLHKNIDAKIILQHVKSVEDQDHLRHWLEKENRVAFVADGAVLPRRSGIDDRPMEQDALAFKAPESLARKLVLPNAGEVCGMGIPKGVTLIVGGGFHGKSTLLHAIERGVYNHIPGDGREQVATVSTAMKVRAEDGRAISNVNISPFIDRLPFGRDTQQFTTDNASGSTSQAANIIEALESGSQLLLIDEDTSATNFMIRDERMQQLVVQDKEPITPFLHRVRELYEQHGISTIMVMGGSGDYFEVADTVIMMDCYEPYDVTDKAHQLAGESLKTKTIDSLAPIVKQTARRPGKKTLEGSRGRHEVKIDSRQMNELYYGEHHIDLDKVEQLVDRGQTRAIGWMIYYYATHYADNNDSLMENLTKVYKVVEEQGLDAFTPYTLGTLALPRIHELAAAINRIREGEWL